MADDDLSDFFAEMKPVCVSLLHPPLSQSDVEAFKSCLFTRESSAVVLLSDFVIYPLRLLLRRLDVCSHSTSDLAFVDLLNTYADLLSHRKIVISQPEVFIDLLTSLSELNEKLQTEKKLCTNRLIRFSTAQFNLTTSVIQSVDLAVLSVLYEWNNVPLVGSIAVQVCRALDKDFLDLRLSALSLLGTILIPQDGDLTAIATDASCTFVPGVSSALYKLISEDRFISNHSVVSASIRIWLKFITNCCVVKSLVRQVSDIPEPLRELVVIRDDEWVQLAMQNLTDPIGKAISNASIHHHSLTRLSIAENIAPFFSNCQANLTSDLKLCLVQSLLLLSADEFEEVSKQASVTLDGLSNSPSFQTVLIQSINGICTKLPRLCRQGLMVDTQNAFKVVYGQLIMLQYTILKQSELLVMITHALIECVEFDFSCMSPLVDLNPEVSAVDVGYLDRVQKHSESVEMVRRCCMGLSHNLGDPTFMDHIFGIFESSLANRTSLRYIVACVLSTTETSQIPEDHVQFILDNSFDLLDSVEMDSITFSLQTVENFLCLLCVKYCWLKLSKTTAISRIRTRCDLFCLIRYCSLQQPLLNITSKSCINSLASVLDYDGSLALLQDHSDFISAQLISQLCRFALYPHCVSVLSYLISRGDVLQEGHIRALCPELLSRLDENYEEKTSTFLHAMFTLLKSIDVDMFHRQFEADKESRKNGLDADDYDSDEERVVNLPADKQPFHVAVSTATLQRCKHLLYTSSRHPSIVLECARTIELGLNMLKYNEDCLLPQVHQCWAACMARLRPKSEPSPAVRQAVFTRIIKTMAVLSGDFIARRVVDDVIPVVTDYLRDQSRSSNAAACGSQSLYKQSQDYKLQLCFLQELPDVFTAIKLRVSPAVSGMVDAVSKCYGANSKQPKELIHAAKSFCNSVNSLDKLET